MPDPTPTLSSTAIPYRPSNGDEGRSFIEHWCNRCTKDAGMRADPDAGNGCPILAATMIFDTEDAGYPPEWIEDDVPGLLTNPRCTAFVLKGADTGPIEDARQETLL